MVKKGYFKILEIRATPVFCPQFNVQSDLDLNLFFFLFCCHSFCQQEQQTFSCSKLFWNKNIEVSLLLFLFSNAAIKTGKRGINFNSLHHKTHPDEKSPPPALILPAWPHLLFLVLDNSAIFRSFLFICSFILLSNCHTNFLL